MKLIIIIEYNYKENRTREYNNKEKNIKIKKREYK